MGPSRGKSNPKDWVHTTVVHRLIVGTFATFIDILLVSVSDAQFILLGTSYGVTGEVSPPVSGTTPGTTVSLRGSPLGPFLPE